eukprot:jgi/Ulvmu1/5871/UM025_0133.1
MFEGLFGKKKTPAEMLRENKRLIDKSIREIDRERNSLQTQERKLIEEMKKNAKNGQMDSVKVLAKSLVRNRQYVTKMHGMKANLQAVSLKITTLKSTEAMAKAMAGATKAMGTMNKRMNIPALAKIMKEFERQNAKMDQVEEMMGDAMDDVFEEGDEEEETDKLVQQVFLEIGINAADGMVSAPSAAKPAAQQEAAAPAPEEPIAQGAGADAGGGSGVDAELEARLNALRGK